MRHLLIFISIIGLLSCSLKPQSLTPVKTDTVEMVQMRFEPKVIRVNVGTTVTWVNHSSAPHNVVGESFKSPFLMDQQSWSLTFKNKGTFDYYCEPHHSMGMTGIVIVE